MEPHPGPALEPAWTRIGILLPLRIRDFRLLWAGMSVSLVGDGIYLVAIALEVYSISDKPSALALVGLAWTGPMVLVLLFSGVLSDRLERRRLLIAADVVRCLAFSTMGALVLNGTVRLWHLAALAAVYGIGEAIWPRGDPGRRRDPRRTYARTGRLPRGRPRPCHAVGAREPTRSRSRHAKDVPRHGPSGGTGPAAPGGRRRS